MLLLAVSLSLALSACMPAFLQQTTNPTPVQNIEATAAAFGATMAAQTLAALPTASLVPSNTPVIVVVTSTSTATSAATATMTGTEATAAAGVTGTPPTPSISTANLSGTPTLGVQYYGTIPPLVPSGRVIMVNRSHAQAYVSFQCINQEGTLSILEYPVSRWMEEKIPSGKCKYVAWVGGREFAGSFSLDTGGQRRIVFYIDRVRIN
jgi:hypothetical protein